MRRRISVGLLAILLQGGALAAADPELVRLGAEVARAEAALADARAALRAAAVALTGAEVDLARRQADSFGAFQAMDRLGRAPALAYFLHPAGPTGAARASVAVEAALPTLRVSLSEAQSAAAELERLRADGVAATQRLSVAAESLAGLRAQLSGRLDQPERADALAALRSALERPADDRVTIDALVRRFGGAVDEAATPRGRSVAPVVGELAAAYAPTTGLAVATAPYAIVRAPLLATLRHVGRTAQGGMVAVLEPQAGVLIVLRGLGRVDRAPGEVLTAGEPLGAMGGPAAGGADPGANDFLIDASALTVTLPDETLYIDLRVGGDPADPTDWFPPAEQRTNR